MAEWPMQQVSRLKITEWPFLLPLLSLRPIRAAVRLTMGRVGCQTSQVCFCTNTRKKKKEWGGGGDSIKAERGLRFFKQEMADDYIVAFRTEGTSELRLRNAFRSCLQNHGAIKEKTSVGISKLFR